MNLSVPVKRFVSISIVYSYIYAEGSQSVLYGTCRKMIHVHNTDFKRP